MKRLHFFATNGDLLPVFASVERKHALQYVPMGQFENAGLELHGRGADLPDLGTATADSAVSSRSYLVAERTTEIRSRSIKGSVGAERFCIDQLVNPDSVTLTPGGARGSVILHGRVATVSGSVPAQALMKSFDSALRREFQKVKAFWVGPSAMKRFDAGTRLTIGVHSPSEFDLKR